MTLMGTKSWDEIKEKAASETIAAAARKTDAMLAAFALTESRKAPQKDRAKS